MSPNLFFNKKKYLSTQAASALTGYSRDYIGQLAREGKIESTRVSRVWYVEEESLLKYKNLSLELETLKDQREGSLNKTQESSPVNGVNLDEDLSYSLKNYPVYQRPVSKKKTFSRTQSKFISSALALGISAIIFSLTSAPLNNLIRNNGSTSDNLVAQISGSQDSSEVAVSGNIKDFKSAWENYLTKPTIPSVATSTPSKTTVSTMQSAWQNYLTKTKVAESPAPVKVVAKPETKNPVATTPRTTTVATISQPVLISALRSLFASGNIPEDVMESLRGPKGEKGESGQMVTSVSPSAPAPIPAYFLPGGVVQPQPSTPSFSGATIFSATELSTTNFNANKADIGTLNVSGLSTLNNVNIQGGLSVTGNLNPNLTEGSVFFQGSSGIAEDNSNLFFDNTTNRLGVGTNTPTQTLDVVGTLTSSGSTTLGTGVSTTNTFGSGASSINIIGSTTTPGTLTLHGSTTLDNNFLQSGAFTFGTGTGAVSLNGNTSVTGTNTFTVGTGLTTLGGNLLVSGAETTISSTAIELDGTDPVIDLTSASTLNINTTTNRPVTFGTGTVTIPNLVVTNSQGNNGTMTIDSDVTTATIFSIVGDELTSGTGIAETITANAGNGQITKGHTISVTDDTVGGGGYTGLAVSVSGSGTGSGNKYLLDLNPGANIQVVFDSTGALRPTTDVSTNTNTIGSPSFYWKNGYFDQITANNIAGTVVGGATSSTTWTIGSTEAGDVNEALIFQRNSGSGNASLQWNAGASDLRYLTVNYPFNSTYTVNDASIGTSINLYSGNLTNNTTGGTQRLLSLSNSGTGTTENGIYINNTGTGTTAFEIAGTWTNGIVTNNNSINAGTGALTAGTTTVDNIILGGGYGSTGVSISNTGNISANGNLIVDGTVTSGLINGQTISSAANFTGTVAVATSLSINGGSALTTTNQTGTGSIVMSTSPTLVTPALGAATGTSLVLTGSLTSNALTSGRVTFAGTDGILQDDADLTFATDTLTATKVLAPTSISSPLFISTGAINITPNAGDGLNINLSTTGDFAVNTDDFYVDTSTGRVGIGTATPTTGFLQINGAVTNSIANIALSANAGGNAINFGDDGTDVVIGPGNSSTKLHLLSRAGGVYSRSFTLDSSGNVGIGTTTISARLHPLSTTEQLRLGYDASNYASFTTSSAGNLTIAPSGGTTTITGALDFTGNMTITKADPSLILNTTTATDTDFWLGVQEDAGGDDDDTFQIGDGTTPGSNAFLSINTSGNVGVGTTNAGYRLTVAGGADGAQLWVGTDTSFGYSFGRNSSNGDLNIKGYQGLYTGYNFLDPSNNSTFYIAASSVNGNTGYIGIGTSVPTNKIHAIQWGALNNKIALDLFASNASLSSGLLFRRSTQHVDNSTLFATINGDLLGTFEFQGTNFGNTAYANAATIKITQNGTAGATYVPANISFLTSDGTNDVAERLTINSSGNVGIGTTTISARLHSLATTEQLRLGYDASNYLSTTVGSTGNATFSLTGTSPQFIFSQRLQAYNGLLIGNSGDSSASFMFAFDGSSYGTPSASGRNLSFFNYNTSQTSQNSFVFTGDGTSPTSGTGINMLNVRSFAPTSGTAVFNLMELRPTINQTGGANGITRGLLISPTLTAAADWRALQIGGDTGYAIYQSGASSTNYFAGNVGIGTTTISAKLHSLSTTEQLRLGYDASNYNSFTVSSTGLLTIDPTGSANRVHIDSNLSIPATSLLYLDGGSNTYISESSADTISLVAGGTTGLGVNSSTVYIPSGNTFFIDGGSNTGIYEGAADTFYFRAGGVEAMQLYSNQMVLAGNYITAKQDPAIVFNAGSASDTKFWAGVTDDNGNDDDDLFQIGDGTTPGTNPFLTIDTSGNVGIGVTNLTVSGANAKLGVAGGNINLDNTNSLAWGGGTDRPYIQGNKATGFLAFGLGGSERWRINSSGHFIAGADNTYDIGASGATRPRTGYFGTSVISPLVTTPSLTTSSGAMTITPAAGSNLDVNLSTTGDFTVNTNDLYVDTSGSMVGINKIPTIAALDILGNIAINTTGANNATYYSYADGVQLMRFDTSTAGVNLNSVTNLPITILTNNTERITIEGGGDVGIGTTNPGQKLSVAGELRRYAVTAGNPQEEAMLTYGSAATDTGGLYAVNRFSSDNRTDYLFKTSNAGGTLSEVIRFTNDGRVGIGDTSPDAKLEIASAVGSQADIRLSDADVTHGFTSLVDADTFLSISAGGSITGGGSIRGFGEGDVNGLFLQGLIGETNPTDSTAAVIFSAGKLSGSTQGALGASETAFNFNNYDSSSTFMTILGGGNIGIGTTNPLEKLTVVGNGVFGSDAEVNHGYDDTWGITDYVGVIGDASTDIPGIILGEDDGTNNYRAGIYFDIPNTNVVFRNTYSSGSTSDWIFYNGNVGIGTTNPSQARLQILGSGTTSSTSSLVVEDSAGTDMLAVRDDGSIGFGKNFTQTSAGEYYALTTAGSLSTSKITVTNSSGGTISNGVGVAQFEIAHAGSDAYTAGKGLKILLRPTNTSTSNVFSAFDSYATLDATNARAATLRNALFTTDTGSATGGTITNLTGVESAVAVSNAGVTATNAYGLNVSGITNAGTITNTYGLYIGDITSGTQTNQAYGVYQSDTGARNYFGGSVGIGTTNPSQARLQILGSGTTSSTSSLVVEDSAGTDLLTIRDDASIGFGKTTSLTSNSAYSFLRMDATDFDDSVTITNNSGGDISAMQNIISLSPTYAGTNAFTRIRGISNIVNISSSDTDNGSTEMFSLYSSARLNTTGRATNMYAAYFDTLSNDANGGTITNMIGSASRVGVQNASVTATNVYAIQVADLINAGTITNTYGVYVGDVTTGTQTSQAYGIYVSDTNARNFFAGNVGIGTNSSTRRLSINSVTGARDGNIDLRNSANSIKGTIAIDNNTDELSIAAVDDLRFYAGATIGTIADLPTNQRMVINTSGNVGIGTTNPSQRLQVELDNATTNAVSNVASFYHTTTGTTANGIGAGILIGAERTAGDAVAAGSIQGIITDVADLANDGGALAFTTRRAGTLTEAMRIIGSGNVGIGSTSPQALLDVVGGIRVNSAGTVTSGFANGINMGTWDALGYNSAGTQVALGGYRAAQFSEVGLYTIGSERLRVNTSGHLNLISSGVAHGLTSLTTTDAYTSFRPTDANLGGLQVYGITDADGTAINLSAVIGATDPADTTPAFVLQSGKSNGGTSWQALGNNETVLQVKNFTTNMLTVLGSGNVGIGTDSPSTLLNLQRSGSGGNIQLTVENVNADQYGDAFQFYKNTASPADGDIMGYMMFRGRDDLNNVQEYASFYATSDDVTSGTEDGSFHFFTDVAGAQTEVLTIKTGNVGIGTTSPDRSLYVVDDIASSAMWLTNDGNNSNRKGITLQVGADDASGTNTAIEFLDGDQTAQGSITFSGGTTSYNTTSDFRLKTNIADTSLGIATLRQIQVKDYTMINDTAQKLQTGFIAQDLFPIYPNAVTVPNDPNGIWSVDYSKLTPLLVKSVQDLDIEISSLEDRITALEENLGNGGLTGMAADFFSSGVQSVVDGIAYVKGFVVEKLTIGSPTKRTGVTFFDEVTGDPYCLSIANGTQKVVSGECVIIIANVNNAPLGGGNNQPTGGTPVITLNGDGTISLSVGGVYEELGATANDAEDGAVAVIISGSVDTNTDGTYTITYTSTDSNSNVTTATRTVIVGTGGEAPENTPAPEETPSEEPQPEETPSEEPTPEPTPEE